MPFVSEQQRKYLWKFHPEIAKRWTDKYGSKILRKKKAKKSKVVSKAMKKAAFKK